ncbi:integral membrane protein [Lactiplantibacillus pentosus DSM 20314]|nr:integral membrane protein [Lactiplantibacillus pentosus DSM 20314]
MTGVVFLIAAYFVIKQPQAALLSLVFLFAIAAIISGITTIGGYTKLRRETGLRANFALVFAIIDILVGLLFLFHAPAGILVLGYVFAFWFLIDSIERLTVVSHLRVFGTGYYVLSLILDIISLALGIMLIINPMIAVVSFNVLVSFYFAVFGINAILIAFARRN